MSSDEVKRDIYVTREPPSNGDLAGWSIDLVGWRIRNCECQECKMAALLGERIHPATVEQLHSRAEWVEGQPLPQTPGALHIARMPVRLSEGKRDKK